MSKPIRILPMAQWDVFSKTPLEGNSLAVFFGGCGLSDVEMQAIAREMNLSEPGSAAGGHCGVDGCPRCGST